MLSSPPEQREKGLITLAEKQNHEVLLRGRVSIINNASPSITLFLLGGLFRFLGRGLLLCCHGFFTPLHSQEIDPL
jgi:hypothetical protein